MNVAVDMAYKSLIKNGEELCGDKVELVTTEQSRIMILADGMGSGIRANILATLTSKILKTMFYNDLEIEEAVSTIARTLPISSLNDVAYSTFSILQIFTDGRAYLVEYDNPACVFVRDGKIQNIPYQERIIEEKKIREYRFEVRVGDAFVLMSDGTLYAGTGDILNYAWDWQSMADYTLTCVKKTKSAMRMAALLDDACNDLYGQVPGDDVTVAVARVIEEKVVVIMTGPPEHQQDDKAFVEAFMQEPGKKVVSGGMTSNLLARELGRSIETPISVLDKEIPPTSRITGIDLVTEGIITLNRAISLLEQYARDDVDVEFFEELDKENGASQLARLLIEDCTTVKLYVGRAVNKAHTQKDIPFEITTRQNLIKRLEQILNTLHKQVSMVFY